MIFEVYCRKQCPERNDPSVKNDRLGKSYQMHLFMLHLEGTFILGVWHACKTSIKMGWKLQQILIGWWQNLSDRTSSMETVTCHLRVPVFRRNIFWPVKIEKNHHFAVYLVCNLWHPRTIIYQSIENSESYPTVHKILRSDKHLEVKLQMSKTGKVWS